MTYTYVAFDPAPEWFYAIFEIGSQSDDHRQALSDWTRNDAQAAMWQRMYKAEGRITKIVVTTDPQH